MVEVLTPDDMAPERAPTTTQRIHRIVLDRILRGEYSAGQALPSENELAREFGVTRLTARSAVDGLVESGMVRRLQGKGTFVVGPLSLGGEDCAQPKGFRELAEERGVPSVRVLSQATRLAGPWYADLLGVDEDSLLYNVRRLNSLNGVPVSIENTFIPLSLFPGIQELDLTVFSLYGAYESYGHKVVGTQEKLDITVLGARSAGLLRVPAGTPALVLECISYDVTGTPLEYVHSLASGEHDGYLYTY